MRLIDADKILYPSGRYDGKQMFKALIDAMPTVDAEPVRHGEWIKAENPCYSPFDSTWENIYVCSLCSQRFVRPFNYCGYCGAKMDGGETK